MAYLEQFHFEAAFQSALDCLNGESAAQAFIRRNYASLQPRFNYAAIDYCLATFIVGELDAKTPGERGFGRVSTHVPRLGAYCRDQMQSMDTQTIWNLYYLIQDLMLRGYLSFALFVEDPSRPAKYRSGPEIYDRWLPIVYSDAGTLRQDMLQTVYLVADSAFETIDEFLADQKMPQLGESDEKMREIFGYYATGGVWIRAVEVGQGGR